MNARDNIKPKSIRVAILQALSDGAITTIDDLQIKTDEKREKIANNVYPAAAEGLIKRMRDDVTGGAAYQILPKGRELLAKYASGKVEVPADVVEAEKPTVRENRTVAAEAEKSVITPRVMRVIPAPEVSRRKSESVAVEVLETAMPGFTAAVVAQKDEEIARLNGAIKSAQGHIETLNGTIAQLGKEKDAFVAEIDRLWGKINGLKRRPAGEMREMLRAMQYGEMTVSRGVELLEIWLAGNYSDEYLPAVTPLTNDDETPVDVLARTNRLFLAACQDLALINTRLGLDPNDGGAAPILNAIDQLKRGRDPVGYVLNRPGQPMKRFSKAETAKARALSFARGYGIRCQAKVFALHLVGTAVPGSEWKKA